MGVIFTFKVDEAGATGALADERGIGPKHHRRKTPAIRFGEEIKFRHEARNVARAQEFPAERASSADTEQTLQDRKSCLRRQE